MKITAFQNHATVREIGTFDEDKLIIQFENLPDNTLVCIRRTSDMKMHHANIIEGVATFEKSFFNDGEYMISFDTAEKNTIVVWFEVASGSLTYKTLNGEVEFHKLWDVLAELASRISAAENKIENVVDGYVTE